MTSQELEEIFSEVPNAASSNRSTFSKKVRVYSMLFASLIK
jgi:hypothetical protein